MNYNNLSATHARKVTITLLSPNHTHHNREVRGELISLSEIKERADKIKRKLFITPEQKSHIEERKRDQADCEAWYRHRKPLLPQSVNELL